MAAQTVRDWRRAARSTVHGYPEIKQKTKDATNSDLWGPTDAQKSEIAEASFNEENRTIVLKALWKRVDDKTEYWMHVYKALDVLEYLLLVDVPGIFNDLRFHHQQITQLQQYMHAKHKDSKEQEKLNDKVRIKAARVLNLMGDGDLLQAERQKLRLIMARITGVSDQQIDGGTSAGAGGGAGGGGGNPMPHEAPHARPGGAGGVNAVLVERELGGGRAPPAGGPGAGIGNRGSQNQQGGGQPKNHGTPGDDFELDMDVLQQVMEMGFNDQDAVVTAMLAADNNLERTVQYLVNQPESKSTPPPQAGNVQTTAVQPDVQPVPEVKKDRGMSDLFAPTSTTNPPPPPTTSNSNGLRDSAVHRPEVVDIFGNNLNTTTAPPGSHDTGLWKAEAPPEEKKASPPPVSSGGFDPFAPTPAELTKPTTTSTQGGTAPGGGGSGGGGMPDFFASNKPPQEATKARQGQTPPPAGGPPDLFGPGPTTATTMPPPPQQPVDLFGAPAPNTTSVDLFGAPARNTNTQQTAPPPSQNDLFGAPAPQAQVLAPQAGAQQAPTQKPPAKELTGADKMMAEFTMMGKPQQKAPPKPMQQQASLDQLMLGGQNYGK